MKKSLLIILMIGLIAGMISSCNITNEDKPNTEPKLITEKVLLYYGSTYNENFVTEEREVTYDLAEHKFTVVLEELIKGPNNQEYRANIPKETKVYETLKQNDRLIINLSKEFNSFGGSIAEIIAVGSIVNTLTQFDDVNSVKILVEGEELIAPSGMPRGFMEPFTNNTSSSDTVNTSSREVILYFSEANANGVLPEKRLIQIKEDSKEALVIAILEELIKGPTMKDLYPTIPKEVKVLKVEIRDGIAYIDFSEEMHTKHWHGATGEALTIASIANTLTELDYIQKVKMTVASQPMNIEHAILDEPIGRNEEMIIKK